MKKYACLFILFAAVLFCLAIDANSQSNLLFEETFEQDNGRWPIEHDEEIETSISNHQYTMVHKRNSASWRFYHPVLLNANENFYLETSLKQLTGETDNGYGIIWHSEFWNNSYNFIITSSGFFRIYSYTNGNFNILHDWQESEHIKPKNEANILGVRKFNDKYFYLINGNFVAQTPAQKYLGVNQGFVLTGSISVAADYLKIYHAPMPINLAPDLNESHEKQNLGTHINSYLTEIAPIISPDGKTLYLARQNLSIKIDGNNTYDIWYTTRNNRGAWNPIKMMPWPINNEGDNLVIAVSADGNTLYLEGLYNNDGSYQSDNGISVTHRTAKGWQIPKAIKIHDFYNKNTYESFCFSQDGEVLIMSVERDDTYGQKDLYVSFKQNDGSYSTPQNMGSSINTFDNDGTPFLASDNKTLYFYSYGHPGFGSADIFVSKRLDDSWIKWSKPQNLGKNVNSAGWDTYYSVSAVGDYAYLVSSEKSYGFEDIFQIKLDDSSAPEPVVVLNGIVFNSKTGKPIEAIIKYEDLDKKKHVGTARSNPHDGTFKLILPYGKNYGIHAEADNFLSTNENINLESVAVFKEVSRNLYLTPIEVGESIELKNVFFIQSESTLYESSYPELDRLAELLLSNKKLKIELAGHTETGGRPEALQKLSDERVATVKNYLVKKGVSATRISGKGYGGKHPVTSESDDQLRNRRVEFTIIGK